MIDRFIDLRDRGPVDRPELLEPPGVRATDLLVSGLDQGSVGLGRKPIAIRFGSSPRVVVKLDPGQSGEQARPIGLGKAGKSVLDPGLPLFLDRDLKPIPSLGPTGHEFEQVAIESLDDPPLERLGGFRGQTRQVGPIDSRPGPEPETKLMAQVLLIRSNQGCLVVRKPPEEGVDRASIGMVIPVVDQEDPKES